MTRRPLLFVSGTLAVAVILLVVVGLRVWARDRDELFDRYGVARAASVEEAARGLALDVADIGEDLALAATLLRGAESEQLAERELHAIATIKREYLAMYARRAIGATTTKVSAYDAPPGVASRADATIEQLLARAERQPEALHVSTAFAPPGDPAAWYRVFARKSERAGPAVAVVVDTAVLLSRVKLPRDALARRTVVDGAGATAPSGDPELATVLAIPASDQVSRTVVDGTVAARCGLPATDAIVVSVPLQVDGGPPWRLVVVTSTQALQAQQRTIVRRVLVGSVLVVVLLLSASVYVLRNTFRARSLRERLRDAERLAHSEKLVTAGQLAAGIAHEIGTPLGIARGRVELALSHLGPTHAEAENHRLVIDQIDRVTRLIQQLLDYVRPAALSVQSVRLAQSLHAVKELLSPQAGKRGVTLEIDAAESVTLTTDPDQIQQIVMNLTLNAIDACEKGGTVVMRTHRRDRANVLEIVDSGPGIPRDIQKQIFDPFFTTKKRGQGTGLGLWVVAQLVRAQAAEIELESSSTGTTVRIVWPDQRAVA